MAYVITDRCVQVKDQSCVEVCPVDCIHPVESTDGPEAFDEVSQLYINPDVCIDCGVCVPECPVEAIVMADELSTDDAHFAEINRAYYETHTVG